MTGPDAPGGPGGPVPEGMIRALFLGGGREGPPVEIPALDGSPPQAVTFAARFATQPGRGPGSRPVLATSLETYVLAPHQHQSTSGQAPFRYVYTGEVSRFGLPD